MDNIESKIRELEAQLRQLSGRNRELEAQLDDALERANAADRAKASFIANTSHELHTPLSAILGYAELMREDVRNGHFDGLEDDLSKQLEAGMRLLAIVNQLLDLSKIEATAARVHLVEFEVEPLVEQVVGDYLPLMAEQGNSLRLTIAPEVETLVADAHKVEQILANLLSNAGKFTAEGEVTVRVCTAVRDGVQGVQFTVSDTGIGMDPARMDNIFQAFTQIDPSATRHYEGLGLGLHLCWQFCQLMGGDIAVESEYGAGATFTVWLPQRVKI